jgi:hypothetical protein
MVLPPMDRCPVHHVQGGRDNERLRVVPCAAAVMAAYGAHRAGGCNGNIRAGWSYLRSIPNIKTIAKKAPRCNRCVYATMTENSGCLLSVSLGNQAALGRVAMSITKRYFTSLLSIRL